MFEKPKWIIQDGELRMGRVEMHEQLVNKDGGSVKGGGLWHFEPEGKTLYLYAKSFEYCQVSEDDFDNVWVQPSLENATIYFSTRMTLEEAKKNNILIQNFDHDTIN